MITVKENSVIENLGKCVTKATMVRWFRREVVSVVTGSVTILLVILESDELVNPRNLSTVEGGIS